jgi:acetyl-CoA C-acetyltransferase
LDGPVDTDAADRTNTGTTDTVLVDRRGPVAVITLNRPERKNAVDQPTAELLERIVDELEADDEVKVVIITGAGGSFCAGMDLKAAAGGQFAMTERGGPLGITARPMSKPLVAAVEGHALAGGFELALVADLIVASTDSQFGLPEPKRGLVAAAGGVLRVSQRLPRNVARELALTGNPMPASRMAELGLVNRLAEPGQVLDAALALADEIQANAPLSVRVSKQIIEQAPDWTVEEAFGRQSDLAMTAVLSEDAVEGIAAFAEKRPPVWKGR